MDYLPVTLALDDHRQWLQGVRQVLSPNCDDRPAACDVDAVILHGISLPPGQYGGPYIDQLFTNTLDAEVHPYFADIIHLRVSAHVMISRTGAMTQYVPFDRRAWYAGESQLAGRSACNDFSIGIELEGCDDQEYTGEQYDNAAAVVKLLMSHFDAISPERVVGHSDVAPGRKTDPGPAFDWQRFYSLLDRINTN